MIRTLEEEAEIIRQNPGIRILTNYQGAPASNEFMDKLRELTKDPAFPTIRKDAILGITGIKKVFFRVYAAFSNDKSSKVFDKGSDALSWLVS